VQVCEYEICRIVARGYLGNRVLGTCDFVCEGVIWFSGFGGDTEITT
jgi:hypothetical protein